MLFNMEIKEDDPSCNDSLYCLDCDSGDEAYKHDKENMSDDDMKVVNKMYDSAKPYLDDQFSKEFPKRYYSRYFELVVASQILNSQYGNNLVPKAKQRIIKGASSIDFKLTLPDQLLNGLAIECVCPDFGENIIRDKEDFKYSEDYCINSGLRSYEERGENWHIMSRFTNIITKKVDQFKKCVESGTIADNSYKILFISGATLRMEEAKRRGLKVYSLRSQFILAFEGVPKCVFPNDGSTPRFESGSYAIKKKEKKTFDYEEVKEYVDFLDGIIYFEDTPLRKSSPPFYHCFVKEEIKEIINTIFPAD